MVKAATHQPLSKAAQPPMPAGSSAKTQPRAPVTATARKVPLMRTSHTPRSIRLACDLNRRRLRPKVVVRAPQASSSMAIVARAPREVAVYEEPVPMTLFMDYGGHCHAKLDDGGYLFMDQFGHCHAKLDDGGYLYMDPQGSCHKSLNDRDPATPPGTPNGPRPNSAPRRHSHTGVTHRHAGNVAQRQREVVAMLGDLSLAPKSKTEVLAHDTELRHLQGKPLAQTGYTQRRAEMVKSSKAARRSHSIGQPRRHN